MNEVNFEGKLWERLHSLEVDVARLQEGKKAAEIALALANKALEHTQAQQNEWRQENIDQRALFMTEDKTRGLLSEEGAERRALEGRVSVLEKGGSAQSGRHSAFEDVWLKFAVVVTLLMTAAGLLHSLMATK
jgi:hypothetical protein